MAYDEEINTRYKGIEIRVEKLSDDQYDGVFTWNGREIRQIPPTSTQIHHKKRLKTLKA